MAHLAADAIYVWQMEPTIERATAEAVAANYASQDNPTGDVADAQGFGRTAIANLPKKVRDRLVWPYFNWMYGNAAVGAR